MHKNRFARLFLTAIMSVATTAGIGLAASTPANAAYGTVCRTVWTNSQLSTAIIPRMSVPLCWNGDKVWQNGNVSAGVNTFGYQLNGIDWAGTYNGGNSMIGVGMNYRVSAWGNWWSFTCLTRWVFNAHGQQVAYNRGC